MDATFLGTAGAIPTTKRNPSGIFVDTATDDFLLDAGEGTVRQMQRYSTGFDVAANFITHTHGDHVFGLPGLLATVEFYDRTSPLAVYTPSHTGAAVQQLIDAPGASHPFPVEVTEVNGGEHVVDTRGCLVEAFETEHRTRSVGYRIVTNAGGDERRLVNTGDTRPTDTTVSMTTGADLLIHDGMFEQAEASRARKTGHSTSVDAADIAVRAGVDRLALTHISSRHADDVSRLEAEAEAVKVFGAGAFVPRDGQTVAVSA